MNKLLGKIYSLKETNSGFILLYGLETVCGGCVAERLERWTFNWGAPLVQIWPQPPATASWICSWQSLVQILGHACKIANWFASD